jgi:hypothetical protein
MTSSIIDARMQPAPCARAGGEASVMLRRMIVIAALALGALCMGACDNDCERSCNEDSDCPNDQVCESDKCVPEKCRGCGGTISLCYYNRVTCDFIHCD